MKKREKSERLKCLFLYNTSKCTENYCVCYHPVRYCHETVYFLPSVVCLNVLESARLH